MPRVLYVSFLHPSVAPGGAQQVAYEMFEAARSENIDAFFLAAIDPHVPLKLAKPGAVITGFEERRNEYLFFPAGFDFDTYQINDERTLDFLAEFLQDIQPSVIHLHHYLFVSTDIILLARKVLPNVKIILHLHEMLAICAKDGQMLTSDRRLCYRSSPVACHKCFPDRDPDFFFIRKRMIKSAFDRIDCFITPTEFLRNRYIDWGLPPDKVFHIPNGTKLEADWRVQTPSSRVNRFGFFGQLIDNKGLEVLFDALSIITRDQSFKKQIVVDLNGSNVRFASERVRTIYEQLRTRRDEVAAAGVELNFLGEYDRPGLMSRMARVDWVIVPSVWWETFALVVSEAWVFGKVPIVSSLGALSERVSHMDNGLHFDVGSANSLAQCIMTSAYNKDLHSKLSSSRPVILNDIEMLRLHYPLYEDF